MPIPESWSGPGGTLPSLTGLRWVAAVLVFACHLTVVEYVRGPAQSVLRVVFGVGSTGVGLFFVLSGFVLAWSHDDRTSARTFSARRIARVWPAHLLFVVVSIGLGAGFAVLRHPGQHPVSDVANVLLVSAWVPAWSQAGNPVAWSLVCEAFFYASFPLLWRVLRTIRSRARLLAPVGVGAYAAVWLMPLLLQGIHLVDSSTQASYHPLARFPEFVLGVVAAVAMRGGVFRGARLRPSVVVVVGAYASAAALGCSRSTAAGVTVLGFVLLVSALARADLHGVRTRLAGRTAVHLGTISFAFYLCHLLVLGVIGARRMDGHPHLPLLPGFLLALAALVVSLAVALATYYGVERPARRALVRGFTRSALRCAASTPSTRNTRPTL